MYTNTHLHATLLPWLLASQAILNARKIAKNSLRFGKVDEAIEYFTKAIDLGDPSLATRCHRSGMYLKKDMFDEALADAEYILEKNEKEIMVRLIYLFNSGDLHNPVLRRQLIYPCVYIGKH